MRGIRASWAVLAIVVVVMVTARPLRERIRPPQPPWDAYLPTPVMEYMIADLAYPPGGSGVEVWLKPYGERAPSFVSAHYRDSTEMLMAAGLLAAEPKAGLQLLEQAATRSGSPAAWSAYASKLLNVSGRYQRLAQAGGDPGDPRAEAKARKVLRDEGLPDRLSLKETEPHLQQLRRWEEADPDNALPVALEAYLLYGLHRDADTLARLEAAAALPRVIDYRSDLSAARSRLLVRMGASELHARFAGEAFTGAPSLLRECARIAHYEGRLAQLRGRPKDAIAWWNASIGLGRRAQESGRTFIELLVGGAVESIGASPTWKWRHDRSTGLANGPVSGGRYFYGPEHEFYVQQVGESVDAEVRDRLIKSKLRTDLIRRRSLAWSGEVMLPNAAFLVALASLLGPLVIAFLALYLVGGAWSGRQADAATHLRPRQKALLAALPTALAVLGLAAAPALVASRRADSEILPSALLFGGLGASLLAAALLPLIAARKTRLPSARLATAWRGNLRAVLPVSIAIGALLYLGLQVTAYGMTRVWIRDSRDWEIHEVTRLKQSLGAKWDNPPIPKDAWRAEYPRLVTKAENQ